MTQLIDQPEHEPHEPSEPHVETAWLAEVRRRGEEIDASQVELLPAEKVFRALLTVLAGCNWDPDPPAY